MVRKKVRGTLVNVRSTPVDPNDAPQGFVAIPADGSVQNGMINESNCRGCWFFAKNRCTFTDHYDFEDRKCGDIDRADRTFIWYVRKGA